MLHLWEEPNKNMHRALQLILFLIVLLFIILVVFVVICHCSVLNSLNGSSDVRSFSAASSCFVGLGFLKNITSWSTTSNGKTKFPYFFVAFFIFGSQGVEASSLFRSSETPSTSEFFGDHSHGIGVVQRGFDSGTFVVAKPEERRPAKNQLS